MRRTRHRLPADAHVIDHGVVGCPTRGTDVDVVECLGCEAFKGILEVEGTEVLRCDGHPVAETAPFESARLLL